MTARTRAAALSVVADLVGTRHAPAALDALSRAAVRGACRALWGACFTAVALAWLATAALATGQACASWTWSLLSRWVPLLLTGVDAGVRWADAQARHGWESFRDGRVERLAGRVLGAGLDTAYRGAVAAADLLPALADGLDQLAGTLRVLRAAAVPVALAGWERVR